MEIIHVISITTIKSIMFECQRCGICCRNIGKAFWAKDMALSNGICKYLDQKTNLCLIYKSRPIFCNVDSFYKEFLSDKVELETFYKMNKDSCERLQRMNENVDR